MKKLILITISLVALMFLVSACGTTGKVSKLSGSNTEALHLTEEEMGKYENELNLIYKYDSSFQGTIYNGKKIDDILKKNGKDLKDYTIKKLSIPGLKGDALIVDFGDMNDYMVQMNPTLSAEYEEEHWIPPVGWCDINDDNSSDCGGTACFASSDCEQNCYCKGIVYWPWDLA